LPLFQCATIFVLTPFVTENGDRDGVPNVLVEAMACGLPVVSTAVAGIPELITHNHNGLLAQPHDVEAIAAALATLIDDEAKRRRLGLAARRTVVEQFDVRMGAQQMAMLFDKVSKGEPWVLS
jgi:glycosyltransferase involved in cell wall biosynthesis